MANVSRLLSDRRLLAEFLACAESDDGGQEPQQLLLAYGPRLSQVLNHPQGHLDSLCHFDPMRRRAMCRTLLQAAHERSTAARADQLRNLSQAAAILLGSMALFRDDHVELDARIVLGSLIADTALKLVRLAVEGYESIILSRAKLHEARRALKFPDLRCQVDSSGFCFVWRGGRGQLRLRNQVVRSDERHLVSHVTAPPQPGA